MIFFITVFVLFVGIALFVLGTRDWYDIERAEVRKRDKKRKECEDNEQEYVDKISFKENIASFFGHNDDRFAFAGVTTIVISAIALLVMCCILVDAYAGLDAKVSKMEEHYKALCFKVESDFARDELGLLNKEIVDEVQNWNENIVYYKGVQRDFWLGVFYPNIYDDFEIIPFEKFGASYIDGD